MNELARPPRPRPTTQAAEGLPRLRWTLAEFERLSELGMFGEYEHIELIGGELVPMHAKGGRHERVRGELLNYLIRRLPEGLKLFSEPGWRPAGGELYLEPEMIICPQKFVATAVPPGEVLLMIEVADSSLAYDCGRKASIYAGLGVRDYWVVDANALTTRIHRNPTAAGYRTLEDLATTAALVPLLLPSLVIKLAELGLD